MNINALENYQPINLLFNSNLLTLGSQIASEPLKPKNCLCNYAAEKNLLTDEFSYSPQLGILNAAESQAAPDAAGVKSVDGLIQNQLAQAGQFLNLDFLELLKGVIGNFSFKPVLIENLIGTGAKLLKSVGSSLKSLKL